ncbi:transposase, partial [Pseudomonas aeruginosa]
MKQMTFADAEYAGKRKQTRKELFLIEMDQVVPWKGLIALIEPFYPWGEGGRPAYPLTAMLRIHLLQNWFGYSDPAMEEALYETQCHQPKLQPCPRQAPRSSQPPWPSG